VEVDVEMAEETEAGEQIAGPPDLSLTCRGNQNSDHHPASAS